MVSLEYLGWFDATYEKCAYMLIKSTEVGHIEDRINLNNKSLVKNIDNSN